MLRSLFSAVALAGLLTGQPAFADPLATTASDHVQPAAVATEQPALLVTLVVVIGCDGAGQCRA
jgi:hypothetical protein